MRTVELIIWRAIFLYCLRQVSDVLQTALLLHFHHGLLYDLIGNTTHVLLERDNN